VLPLCELEKVPQRGGVGEDRVHRLVVDAVGPLHHLDEGAAAVLRQPVRKHPA
jgi:hypothetical protein